MEVEQSRTPLELAQQAREESKERLDKAIVQINDIQQAVQQAGGGAPLLEEIKNVQSTLTSQKLLLDREEAAVNLAIIEAQAESVAASNQQIIIQNARSQLTDVNQQLLEKEFQIAAFQLELQRLEAQQHVRELAFQSDLSRERENSSQAIALYNQISEDLKNERSQALVVAGGAQDVANQAAAWQQQAEKLEQERNQLQLQLQQNQAELTKRQEQYDQALVNFQQEAQNAIQQVNENNNALVIARQNERETLLRDLEEARRAAERDKALIVANLKNAQEEIQRKQALIDNQSQTLVVCQQSGFESSEREKALRAEARAQLEEREKKLRDAEAERLELLKNNTSLQNFNQQLANQLQQLQEQRDSAQRELTQGAEGARNQIVLLDEEVNDLQQQITRLNNERDNAINELAQANTAQIRINVELKDARDRYDEERLARLAAQSDLTRALVQVNQKNNEVETEKQLAIVNTTGLNDATRRITELEASLKQCRTDQQQSQSLQENLSRDLRNETTRRENAETKATSLQQELRELRSIGDLDKNALQSDLSAARATIERLQSELQAKREEAKRASSQIVLAGDTESKLVKADLDRARLLRESQQEASRLLSLNSELSSRIERLYALLSAVRLFDLNEDNLKIIELPPHSFNPEDKRFQELLVAGQYRRGLINQALPILNKVLQLEVYRTGQYRALSQIDANLRGDYVLVDRVTLESLFKSRASSGGESKLLISSGLLKLGASIQQLNFLEMTEEVQWINRAKQLAQSKKTPSYQVQVHFTTGDPAFERVDQMNFLAPNVHLVKDPTGATEGSAYVVILSDVPANAWLSIGTLTRGGLYGEGYLALGITTKKRGSEEEVRVPLIIPYKFDPPALGTPYNTKMRLNLGDRVTLYARYLGNDTYMFDTMLIHE